MEISLVLCFLVLWTHQEGMRNNKICRDSYLLNVTPLYLRIKQKFLAMVSEALLRMCPPTLIRVLAGHVRHTQLGFCRKFNEGPFFQGVGRLKGPSQGWSAARDYHQWKQ